MTKTCKGCNVNYPATKEYFGTVSANKDGLSTRCIPCLAKNARKYWQADKERLNQNKKEYRKAHKKETRLYLEKNKNKISEQGRQYREIHKERLFELSRQWRNKNKRYLDKYIANYYEANRDRILMYQKTYAKENPDKISIIQQRRRSRENNLPATLTVEQWNRIKEYFDNGCAYCGNDVSLTQDHLIAVINGGGYTEENIIPACKRCNCSKKGSPIEKWYPLQQFYTEEREQKILQRTMNQCKKEEIINENTNKRCNCI